MNDIGKDEELIQCIKCNRSYPPLRKHWGDRVIGICLSCQNELMAQSRADASFFRDTVLQRSKGMCEVCGFPGTPILHVHHIRPVRQLGSGHPDNLIALCPNCHAIIHAVPSGNDAAFYGVMLWLEGFMPEQQREKIHDLILAAGRDYIMIEHYKLLSGRRT